MGKKQVFKGFSEEEQQHNERLARLQYGPEKVNESAKRWNDYSETQREAIMQEGNQIYIELAGALEAETPPQDEAVQAVLGRWHQHIRNFYEPTLDILRGLGELYNSHPDFMANIQQIHADLPAYLNETIDQYVDDLEYVEIERMLAEDEARKNAD